MGTLAVGCLNCHVMAVVVGVIVVAGAVVAGVGESWPGLLFLFHGIGQVCQCLSMQRCLGLF